MALETTHANEQTGESAEPKQHPRREAKRLRLGTAIPILMLLLPMILGVFHYRLFDEIISSIPTDNPIHSRLASGLLRIYISTFLVCAIALVFGLGVSWTISRPIRRLIRTTREIATGDLSRTAPIDTGDEFGDLGNSFNEMIASLNRIIAERNQYILECYTGGLIIADADGRILATNTAAEQILGKPAHALVSRPILDVIRRDENTENFAEIVERAVRDRQFVSSCEITIRLHGDKQLPLVVTTSPLRDVGGGQRGVVINFRDLSQIKTFYRRMTRADRLAAVGTLAAGVAHEVRNPLGSIKGLAQMLIEESTPDSQTRRYAEVIVREANHVNDVVRELLEFAQADHHETRLWNVNQLLREALEVARWAAEGDTEAVRVRENYGEVPALALNTERMSRAFINLIANAFEACAPGGEIAVSSTYDKSSGGAAPVVIKIENGGEPIPPENIERIFEPFFSTKPTGTGLGLPIVYQIVTSHGGTIDVESRNNRTLFTVRLPLTAGSPGNE